MENVFVPQAQVFSLPKSSPKRRNEADEDYIFKDKKTTGSKKRTSKQRHASEGLRVKKITSKSSVHSSKTPVIKASQLPSICTDISQSIFTDDIVPNNFQDGQSRQTAHDIVVKGSRVDSDDFSERTLSPSPVQHTPGKMLYDHYTNQHDTNNAVQIYSLQPHSECHDDFMSDDDLDNDLDDEDLIMLSSDIFTSSDSAAYLPSSPTDTEQGHDYESGLSADSLIKLDKGAGTPPRTKSNFVSPVISTTRILAAKARKPIVRSPFPCPVRDRSPIIGLSSTTVLKTCFRIGEAINQSHQASKAGKHVMLELYARVLRSQRDEVKQGFTFCDLFHTKPPYIKAVYDAVIWKQVQLFNYDSKRLLQEGRMCRCMGIMKRDGKEWIMTVLNIWEATWEDIEWVEGIVSS